MKKIEVIEILSSDSDDDAVSVPIDRHDKINKFGKLEPKISFEIEDLKCLEGPFWINDSVINSYLSLMKSRTVQNVGSTNSFFFTKLKKDGPVEASVWEGIKGMPINRYDIFLIPVCTGSHWFLILVDFIHEELCVLDSLGTRHDNEAMLINNFLAFQCIEKLPIVQKEVPQQMNGFDCGAFLLQNAHCLIFNDGIFNYSQTDMPRVRERIKRELMEFRASK